jgi:hypothetical protein
MVMKTANNFSFFNFSDMKQIMILVFMLSMRQGLCAQELMGMIGCDITYQYLDSSAFEISNITNNGQIVIIITSTVADVDFWDYVLSGTLQGINNLYGPNGDNKIRIFANIGCGSISCIYGVSNCDGLCGNWNEELSNIGVEILLPDIPGVASPILDCWSGIDYVSTQYTAVNALMPDNKLYALPFPTSISDIANLVALLDTTSGTNNAKLLYTDIEPRDHCVNENRTGRVWLSNNAKDTMTQATLGFGWNGVEQDTLQWVGSLPPNHFVVLDSLHGRNIHMDQTSGPMMVYVKSVNGGLTDSDAKEDTLYVASAAPTLLGSDQIILEWKTSNFTYYYYMELVDESGNPIIQIGDPTVATGNPVLLMDTFDNGTVYQFPVDLSSYGGECLSLRAYSHTGAAVGAWFKVLLPDGTEILNMHDLIPVDDYDQRTLYTTFYEEFVQTDDVTMSIGIRPNPANALVSVSTVFPNAEMAQWIVFNAVGQIMDRQETASAGQTEVQFDTTLWPPGAYYVSIKHEKAVASSVLMVLRD